MDAETARRLRGSVSPLPFDWRRAARWLLILALCCFAVGIAALLQTEWIVALIRRIFGSAPAVKSIFFRGARGCFLRSGIQAAAAQAGARFYERGSADARRAFDSFVDCVARRRTGEREPPFFAAAGARGRRLRGYRRRYEFRACVDFRGFFLSGAGSERRPAMSLAGGRIGSA